MTAKRKIKSRCAVALGRLGGKASAAKRKAKSKPAAKPAKRSTRKPKTQGFFNF